ncbi:MAG: thiamine pyrophosphate-dependent enzyme [Planctomycetota bacterium]|jgi:thiamine pyrophosphate-dependent acetolactate synthase large subunit-like protein/nitrite reductase/ring-hydroxylating ferredoxin subunit
MNPLTNAVLGVVFLSVGAVATVVMYYLRGRTTVATTKPARAETKRRVRPEARRKQEAASSKPAHLAQARPPRKQAPRTAFPPSETRAGKQPTGSAVKSETRWHKAAEPDELAENSVQAVEAGARMIALTRLDGQYGAIDGQCPHQGGPLTEGTVEDGLLRCPWHGWGFDPMTGKSADAHHGDVEAYKVEVRDDGVYVAVKEAVKTTSTVSDVMVRTMVNWGVRHVFGMVGHSNLGLAEAIRKQEAVGNLTFFGIRHEGAASFACSAYAKLSGRPAACLTIAGPGATNLLTGLWDAHVDRAPVLALTGQVNTQVLGPGAFQEIDQASAFKAVAAWSQTVIPTSNHAELMTLALKHAIVERGVGHLIFPDEVQMLPVQEEEASGPQGRLGEVAISPATESIDQAVDLIANSGRPAIIVGYGARESMDEVSALAEQLNAPILTTFKAKGQIPDGHPLAAGVLGRSGTPIASSLMSSADLLIVFGASFANHTGIDRTKPIIQVDLDRLALGKFHPVTVPVWGEIAVTANTVRAQLPTDLNHFDIRDELAKRWSAWRAEKEKRANEDRSQGVNSAAIFAALTRQAPPDAVIAVDVGNNTYSFGRYFECKNQAILMSGYLGSIGFGFPAAMGAWAAAPDRPVLAVSGDGGFGQYMAEFTTAVKYGMDITHILLNNNELGKISKEQQAGQWPVWQTSLKNPSFAKYAELCGGYGVRVTTAKELDRAIADAIAFEGPALVEIMSDAQLT